MEVIYNGVEAYLQRRAPNEKPERVPKKDHDDIFERISKAMKETTDAKEKEMKKTTDTTECVIL